MIALKDNLVNGTMELDDAKDFIYGHYDSELTRYHIEKGVGNTEHALEHLAESDKMCLELMLLSRLGYTEDDQLRFKCKEQFIPEIESALDLEDEDRHIYLYKKLLSAVKAEEYTMEDYDGFRVYTDDFILK